MRSSQGIGDTDQWGDHWLSRLTSPPVPANNVCTFFLVLFNVLIYPSSLLISWFKLSMTDFASFNFYFNDLFSDITLWMPLPVDESSQRYLTSHSFFLSSRSSHAYSTINFSTSNHFYSFYYIKYSFHSSLVCRSTIQAS